MKVSRDVIEHEKYGRVIFVKSHRDLILLNIDIQKANGRKLEVSLDAVIGSGNLQILIMLWMITIRLPSLHQSARLHMKYFKMKRCYQ